MIAHYAIGINLYAVSFYRFFNYPEKVFLVCIFLKDKLCLVAPRKNMINSAFVLYSQWPCHAESLPAAYPLVKGQGLTLSFPWSDSTESPSG
jgi:hypothetical protein